MTGPRQAEAGLGPPGAGRQGGTAGLGPGAALPGGRGDQREGRRDVAVAAAATRSRRFRSGVLQALGRRQRRRPVLAVDLLLGVRAGRLGGLGRAWRRLVICKTKKTKRRDCLYSLYNESNLVLLP